MTGLATTGLNSCAVRLFHRKTASFPSITHASVPLPCVVLKWLLTLFSCTVSAFLWRSQNLNRMASPAGQMGPCWLTDQAPSGYLSSSLLVRGYSHCQMARAVSDPLQGSCPEAISCAVCWSNTEVASVLRLSSITHTKVRKPGGTVRSREEKWRHLWCTTAAELLDRCHCSP